MFRWIIGSSLQFRFLVLGVAAALLAFGAIQLRTMRVDVFPEFAPPVVEVQTEAIGLSAEEVESLITYSLEELLSGVPWLESTRSRSVTGLSSITLIFKRGTDIMRARQMIQERLALAYVLPNVATPPVILQPLSATSRFMMIAVRSDKVDLTDLSLLARWTMKPTLLGVPGVANVAIWGQRLRQMHVQIDPARLRDAHVVQDDIVAAAGDALWLSPLTYLRSSFPGAGGWIDNRNQRLGIEHSMPIETPEDMAKVAVTSPHLLLTGKSMALGDVAEVTFSHPPLIGDAVIGSGQGLMLVVEKFPGTNTLEVTRGVEQALAELRRGLPGVEIDASVFRLASYVEESISNLVRAMIIGAVLVALIVGTFLFSWRAALICLVSVPLSLAAAVIVLRLTGATINTMALAGLIVALGVVIDNAIVDADVLVRRMRERRDAGGSVAASIYETTLETQSAAIYATLIVLLALTPIFFMGGIVGNFFEPLALAYLLAVVASMVVALTVTPALSLLLLRTTASLRGESVFSVRLRDRFRLHDRYDALLRKAIEGRRTVLVAVGVIAAAAIVAWPFLGQSLLPPLHERELLVNWATAPGTSHAETSRITSRVSRELRSLPGVRNVGAHIGRAVTGDQVVGINSGQIWISIDPEADLDKTIAAIRETVDGYPGIERNLQTYLRDKVNEVLTGQSKPIVVRIFGPSRDVLGKKAEEVRGALADIPGIADLQAEGQLEESEIQVKVNIDAAGRASVKPGDVRRSSATVFSGLVVGYLFKEQKIFEVVVWGAPEVRQSLGSLRDLWVEKSDRTQVRLGDVADVSIVPSPTSIRHERFAPYVDVTANVVGRNPGAVAAEINERLEKVEFPIEFHYEMLGENAERVDAQRRTLSIAGTALIGIFLLLQACFRNWRLALIAFLALLASLVGGVLAIFVGGGVMSLGALVGFLAVLGIAARHNVLLIEGYQRLQENGGAASALDLVLRGTRERFAPIVGSSVVIIAALLPIILFGAVPGLEIVRPTAIVVVGGVVASALLTLFVIPILYLLIGSRAKRQVDLGLENV